jgi:hypothetical protein
MENSKAPTDSDLHSYRVLINFLTQIRSVYEDINAQAKEFTVHLKMQKQMLEEQDCLLQDLASNLTDYEEDAERVLRPKGSMPTN